MAVAAIQSGLFQASSAQDVEDYSLIIRGGFIARAMRTITITARIP